MRVHAYLCVQVYMHVRVRMCACAHVRVCLDMCVDTCMRVCVRACVCVVGKYENWNDMYILQSIYYYDF